MTAEDEELTREIEAQLDSAKEDDLTMDQLKGRFSKAIGELKKIHDYSQGAGWRIQIEIGQLSAEYPKWQEGLGDFVAGLGYADVCMKMVKQLDSPDILENYNMLNAVQYTYAGCSNFSCDSEKFGLALAEVGMTAHLTKILGHKPFLDRMHDVNGNLLLCGVSALLHNIGWLSGVSHYFEEAHTMDVLLPLVDSDHEYLKVVSLLILAYIVEEKDNSKLVDDTNIIKTIIQWMHLALANKEDRIYKGAVPSTLVKGLNKLAVIDENKAKIVEEGALPETLLMLQYTDIKEQAWTAECLWTLAFDKDVRQKIRDFPGLVDALEDLRDSDKPEVTKNVRGALWLIKGDNDPSAASQISDIDFMSSSDTDPFVIDR